MKKIIGDFLTVAGLAILVTLALIALISINTSQRRDVMQTMSINKALVLQKAVRERINDLRSLRDTVAKKEHFFREPEKVVEPQYDVKSVDQKITELEKFLLMTDMAIKESNAKTEIEVNADVDQLLEPLK